MSYAAAYGGHDRAPAERRLRDEHPLGVRRTYADPADEVDEEPGGRRWTFGVAAGALLVAGTFAAGALGLNNGATLTTDHSLPEHAPASPGNNPNDIGDPAAIAQPGDDDTAERKPVRPVTPAKVAPKTPAPAPERTQPAPSGAQGGLDAQQAPTPVPPAPRQPAPQPPAQQQPAPQPESRPGLVEQVVTPVTDTVGGVTDTVTDTVGGVTDTVTDTVGGVLSPVTGLLSAGDQPAMTMINPLGDLLGG